MCCKVFWIHCHVDKDCCSCQIQACYSKEKVNTLILAKTCLHFFSQHHPFGLIHNCQDIDKTEKDMGEIKVKREKCYELMFPCGWSHAIAFQSMYLRTSKSDSLSSHVHWKHLRGVFLHTEGKRKANMISKNRWDCVSLSFVSLESNSGILDMVSSLNQRNPFTELKKRKYEIMTWCHGILTTT